MKCSICHKTIKGFDNNAWPVNDGRCCSDCDNKYVLPLRIFLAGSMKNHILILNAYDDSYRLEEVKEEASLEKLQSIVEGYIELVPVQSKHFYFIVNEEGLLKKLPVNNQAKRLFDLDVVGNIVVCPRNLFK